MGRVQDYLEEDTERRLEAAERTSEANGVMDVATVPMGDVDAVPWMHVEDLDADDETEAVGDSGAVDDVLEALIEAFNDHDLDGCLELCSDDCEMPGLDRADEDLSTALADLWERRPTSTLTPATLDDGAAAMLWEVGSTGSWWSIALVRITVDEDDLIDDVAFDDAADLIERAMADPPEAQLDEGASWQQWEDGVID